MNVKISARWNSTQNSIMLIKLEKLAENHVVGNMSLPKNMKKECEFGHKQAADSRGTYNWQRSGMTITLTKQESTQRRYGPKTL